MNKLSLFTFVFKNYRYLIVLFLFLLPSGCQNNAEADGESDEKTPASQPYALPAEPKEEEDEPLEPLPEGPDLPPAEQSFVSFINQRSNWVDSVFKTLTRDERIAQLMVVEAFSDQGEAHEQDVLYLIEKYKIGGLIYFQGGPVRQARQTNRYQAASKVPLLVSMDAESGIGMRLDSIIDFPMPMLLGAIKNDSLIYKMGTQVAAQFKRMGMHLNFAPVADINNNQANPVISYRSFGENKHKVTAKSLAYFKGMQDNGIIATAKHFPGHGDTNVDSHHDLPIINHTRNRLDSIELYPFRRLIQEGVGGIMVAHMHIPTLDSTTNLPSTLSRPIVTGLLKEEMGYNGLIVTDAMVMKGVTKYFKPGRAEVEALKAGNDVLERMVSVPKAIEAIKEAIRTGELSQREIDRRCKKVLAAKQWAGLDKYKPIDLNNLYLDLQTVRSANLNRQLAEESLTLLRNQKHTFPLQKAKHMRVATLALGASRQTIFQTSLDGYRKTDKFVLPRRSSKKTIAAMRKKLHKYDMVIIAIYGPANRPSNNLGFSATDAELVRGLILTGKAAIILFDNAYTITQFKEMHKSRALLVAYQQLAPIQRAAAKMVAGKINARGKLPVTVDSHFRYGAGLQN